MAKNTKTPAMVLQELTVKKGIAPPEYQIVNSITGSHENRFDYQLNVAGIVARASGTSKQMGKQNVANNALLALAELGIYIPSENPVQEYSASMTNISDPDNSPFKSAAWNFIGLLKELCGENKIPEPVFTEISDVGPPHAREFTYECQVSSIKTQATGNTKKKAKHIAAKDMLEQIKHFLPELSQQCVSDSKALTDSDKKAIDKFTDLNIFFSKIIPNKSVKIGDYSKTLKKLMMEKELTYEDLSEHFQSKNEESLKKILDKLELTYIIHHLQKVPNIVILSLSTDTPFSTIGSSEKYEDAVQLAIIQAFEVMKVYLNS